MIGEQAKHVAPSDVLETGVFVSPITSGTINPDKHKPLVAFIKSLLSIFYLSYEISLPKSGQAFPVNWVFN
jgi:hypothetical protein